MVLVEIADLVVTTFVAVIGLYLAYSYRHQLALRVAEKRLSAYAALWSQMDIASPVRLSEWIDQPLTREERERLFFGFTAWYYENGNGMLVGGNTRALYLLAKDNLVCPVDHYKPELIRKELAEMSPDDRERARGFHSVRQLSLLRNRMKADLEVYGRPYHVSELTPEEEAFLKECDEDLNSDPWVNRRYSNE